MSGVANRTGGYDFTALLADTTSQQWTQPALPRGLFLFDRQAAARLGQYLQVVQDLLTRRSEIVEQLGPLWPRG